MFFRFAPFFAMFAVLAAGSTTLAEPVKNAASPEGSKATSTEKTRAIKRLLIIVHPCPYQIREHLRNGKPAPAGEAAYLDAEKAVTKLWLKKIPELPAETFVVQVDMPWLAPVVDEVHKAFVARLGAGRVCRVAGEVHYPDKPVPLVDYYERIVKQMRKQIEAERLAIDPATCQSELWGQSFEGCAPGYCGAISRRLALKLKPVFDPAMSVPDAPFVLGGKFLEMIPVGGSDIEAFVFELTDGKLGTIFQARLNDQWLDRRPIELALDSAMFAVTTKQGKPVWPGEIKNGKTANARVSMMTADEYYLRCSRESLDALRAAIRGARVGQSPPEKK